MRRRLVSKVGRGKGAEGEANSRAKGKRYSRAMRKGRTRATVNNEMYISQDFEW